MNLAIGLSKFVNTRLILWTENIKEGDERINSKLTITRLSKKSPDGSTNYLNSNYLGKLHNNSELAGFAQRLLEKIDLLSRSENIKIIISPVWQGISAAFPISWPNIVTTHTTFAQIVDSHTLNQKDLKFWYEPRVKSEYFAYKKATVIVANSRASKELVLKDFPNREISIISHSCQIPQSIINRIPDSNRKKEIIFIGRHEYRKGFDLLLDAWKEISHSHADYELLLIGTSKKGPFSEKLDKLPNEIRKKINFAGNLGEEEKFEKIRNAFLVVYPSRYESFGLVAVESMATGTPVLASKKGGLSEIVENYPIALEDDTVSEIVSKVKSLIGDLTLWEECVKVGRELYFDNYTTEKEAMAFIDLIYGG